MKQEMLPYDEMMREARERLPASKKRDPTESEGYSMTLMRGCREAAPSDSFQHCSLTWRLPSCEMGSDCYGFLM